MRGLAVVLLFSSSFASAQPAGGVELSWVRAHGAESCPSALALREETRVRLGYDPFTQPASSFLEAMVERSDQTWRVRLFKRDAEGALIGERELTSVADDCGGLAEAITLAIALAIDPEAALRSPTEANVEPEPRETEPTRAEPPPTPPTPASDPPPARSHRPRLSFGVAWAYDLVPDSAYGVRLRIDGAIRPALRWVVDARLWPEQKVDNGARLGVGLTTASLGLCGGTQWGRFELHGCAMLDLGALHVVVYDPVPRNPGDRVYLGATVGIRPSIAVGGPVRLALEAGASLPLIDHDLNLDGQPEPVFSSARVAPFLSLELVAEL